MKAQNGQWPAMSDVPAGTNLEFHWADGHVRTFENVTQFHIDDEGNHWIVCQGDSEGNQEKAVIRPTWDYKRQTVGPWVI